MFLRSHHLWEMQFAGDKHAQMALLKLENDDMQKKDTKTIEITCSISFRLTKNHGMKSGCRFGENPCKWPQNVGFRREIAPKTHRSSNCQLIQATNSAIAHHGSHQQCSVFQTCAAQPTGKTYALRRKAHATAKGLPGESCEKSNQEAGVERPMGQGGSGKHTKSY